MPKLFSVSALLFCFGLMLLATCTANELQTQVYKIGVEDLDFSPLFSTAENRDNPGVLIEVLDEFAKQRNIKFEYIYLPIMRFASWYDKDGIDFRVPDNPNWHDNPDKLVFSQPIINVKAHTVVLAENRNKPVDLLNKIASLYGFTPSPQWVDRLQANTIQFEYDNSVKVLLKSLMLGGVDGLDINIAVAQHYALQLALDPKQFVVSSTVPVPHFGFKLSTLRHANIVEQFDEFLLQNDALIKTKINSSGLNQ